MRTETAQYSIHRRGGFFYVQFKNPETREWSTPKSTGTSDRNTALLIIAEWMRDGVPVEKTDTRRNLADIFTSESAIEAARKAPLTPEEAARIVGILRDRGLVQVSAVQVGPGSIDFTSFLADFWDYDTSTYVKDRLSHGQSIGRRHCNDMASRVSVHWKPVFQGRSLASITKKDIRDFSVMIAGKGLATATVNKILITGTCALTWAKENDLILSDPGEGLRKFSGAGRPRGILEMDEVAELFKREYWTDDRTYTANIAAAFTGMRAGELLGLRVQDLKTDRIVVTNAWGGVDHLKDTKNHGIRQIPLPPALRRALLDLAATNPHGPAGYIFYGALPDKPMDEKPFLDDFKAAFIAMRVKGNDDPQACEKAEAELKTRNLLFHSWRHFYSSRMADSIDLRKLSNATGHKTLETLAQYASHAKKDDFAEIGKAVAALFAPVVVSTQAAG